MSQKTLISIIAILIIVAALVAVVFVGIQAYNKYTKQVDPYGHTETTDGADTDDDDQHNDGTTPDGSAVTDGTEGNGSNDNQNGDTDGADINEGITGDNDANKRPTTTNNYTPAKDISGKADAVTGTTDKPNVVVLSSKSDDSSKGYEDSEVDVVVIPPVITDGTTFKSDDATSNTTDTSNAADTVVKADTSIPAAKDSGSSDVDVEVGIELEEIKDGEMPDFLP